MFIFWPGLMAVLYDHDCFYIFYKTTRSVTLHQEHYHKNILKLLVLWYNTKVECFEKALFTVVGIKEFGSTFDVSLKILDNINWF
jgi:hypothetical protein